MAQYSFSNLGITPSQLITSLPVLTNNTSLGFLTDPNNDDIFTYLGTSIDPEAVLPSSSDIIDTYDRIVIEMQEQQTRPNLVSGEMTSNCSSFTFFTCPEGNSCVTIPAGSNSIASNVDPTKIENQTLVNNNEYIGRLSNIPIYTYNIVCQDATHIRIGPTGSDWNNVFNFESKDPTKQNIELMDVIGVMLTCIQNLNARISQLESNQALL